MPAIVGTIGKVLPSSPNVNGFVYVNFDAPVLDVSTTPDTIIPTSVASYAIANGVINFTLPETQSQNITATFRVVQTSTVEQFYRQNGELYEGARFQHTDTNWYTGQAPFVSGTNLLLSRVSRTIETEIIPPFSAYVPNVATVELWSLLPRGITPGNVWAGSWAVAEMLTTDARFVNRLPKGLEYMGEYGSGVSYIQNQVVKRDGNLYIWINAATAAGKDPLIAVNTRPAVGAFWDLFIPKGVPGGSGAQIVGYDSAAWNGSSEAAARADVRSAILAIPNPDLSSYVTNATLTTTTNTLAPKNNPTFTGAVKRAAMTFPVATGDRTTEVVTDQYVRDAIADLAVGLNLRNVAIFEEQQTSNVNGGASVNGVNVRNITTTVLAQSWASRSGNTITLQPGSYCFMGEACANGVGGHRAYIVQTTPNASRVVQGRSNFGFKDYADVLQSPNEWAICGISNAITIAANQNFQLWHWHQFGRNGIGLGQRCGEASQAEIYARLTIWKVV